MERTGGKLGACENIERNKALICGEMIQVVLSGGNGQGRSSELKDELIGVSMRGGRVMRVKLGLE